MKLSTAFLGLSFAAVFVAGSCLTRESMAQSYPMIDVKLDRAKVMRVSRPAAMVIIGNPSIADATIKDSQTLIITGKQFGTTNLIVLDSDGEPIADELLKVSAASEGRVVVYRGRKRSTYSCAPKCDPVISLGDDKDQFSLLADQFQTHQDMSSGQDVESSSE